LAYGSTISPLMDEISQGSFFLAETSLHVTSLLRRCVGSDIQSLVAPEKSRFV